MKMHYKSKFLDNLTCWLMTILHFKTSIMSATTLSVSCITFVVRCITISRKGWAEKLTDNEVENWSKIKLLFNDFLVDLVQAKLISHSKNIHPEVALKARENSMD